MSDAIFTVDDDNAVVRYYPSRVPVSSPSAGSARRRVIEALLPSWQALAEYLSRVTCATWTVVDAEAQDEDGSHRVVEAPLIGEGARPLSAYCVYPPRV